MITIGIYKITSPTNKVYIGQSVNIESRIKRYKNLSVKTKNQTKVWRSLLKHGSKNHKYEILEACDIYLLNERERYWQEYFDCVNNGLNCYYTKTTDKSGKASDSTLKRMSEAQLGNNNWLGKTHSDETKDKIRKAATGRKFSSEVNKSKGRKGTIPPLKGVFGKEHPSSKPIVQYEKDGTFLRYWDSLADASKYLGVGYSNISSCCNRRIKSAYGYVWRFKD